MRLLLSCLLSQILISCYAQVKPQLYAIPGQGGDCRTFESWQLEKHFEFHCIEHQIPEKGWSMRDYAFHLMQQIDTSRPFILLGVSIGGMLACEMADTLKPEKLIIISSASSKHQLPMRYRMLKKVPIYKVVPGWLSKAGTYVLQPILEPESKARKALWKKMIADKEPKFLKRSIPMIIEWERDTPPDDLIHIHGSKDHTLPIKHIHPDYIIPGGTHLMSTAEPEVISPLVLDQLNGK